MIIYSVYANGIFLTNNLTLGWLYKRFIQGKVDQKPELLPEI